MRTAFIETLFELAQNDERIVLVVGDLGFGVVDCFVNRLPQQIINAGVAEQNMPGLAAGIALSNKIVFTYSIANFSTLRCLEQIRNDVCYHNANVKVVAIGGGLAYANEVKERILGVPKEMMIRDGSVAEATALAMAGREDEADDEFLTATHHYLLTLSRLERSKKKTVFGEYRRLQADITSWVTTRKLESVAATTDG